MTVSVPAFMVGAAVVRAARLVYRVRCHRKALGAGRWQADNQHSPNAQVTLPVSPAPFMLRLLAWTHWLSRTTRHRLRWRGA